MMAAQPVRIVDAAYRRGTRRRCFEQGQIARSQGQQLQHRLYAGTPRRRVSRKCVHSRAATQAALASLRPPAPEQRPGCPPTVLPPSPPLAVDLPKPAAAAPTRERNDRKREVWFWAFGEKR